MTMESKKLIKTGENTLLLQVRGYKPAPVAWPEMSEEVDELGERMARWRKIKRLFYSRRFVFVDVH